MPKTAPTTKQTPVAQAAQTLAGRWVEVFRAGKHVDSKGRPAEFSQADLDQMIANHALGAAPAVIGHPKHNDPAYARVQEYRRDGDRLFAKFGDVHPAFDAGVQSGAYFNRSLSVYQDKQHGWRVRHVGWLGAVPPAIDGLEPLAFAGEDVDAFEFSSSDGCMALALGLEMAVGMFRAWRDVVIEKEGIDAADKVVPQWRLDLMAEAAAQARRDAQADAAEDAAEGRASFNHPNPGEPMTAITQAQLDAAVAQARKDAEEASAANFAAAQQELRTLKSQQQATRIAAQITGWAEKGLVLPAEVPGLAEFMAHIEDAEAATFSFSAAGAEVKKTAAEFFAEFMAARPPAVKLRERSQDAGNTVDLTSGTAIAKAASDFQAAEEKAGRTITIEAAIAHVSKPR